MKKIISLSIHVIVATVLIIANSSIAFSATPYRLYMGDEEIEFDVAPFIVNERLLVPLRAISEAANATVDWDGSSATVYRGSALRQCWQRFYEW